ncbi:MAG: hypothetical protein A2X23_01850 [Chloroflexi bacterium GWC2_73_18]|nr:MAG: hypothetical protein A2X23_01850 [Chloroflexi bacterium GWC2_73_18]
MSGSDRIVIIGGGAIGLCTAEALQRRGEEVTVLEAGQPGSAASKGNGGWITPSLSDPLPAPGLARQTLRWMLRPDSPFYIRPRPDPGFARWLLAFWRRCNASDFRAGLEALAGLNRSTLVLFDLLRERGVAFEMHADGLLMAFRSPHLLEEELAATKVLPSLGLPEAEPLDRARLLEMEPALTESVAGGIFFPHERQIRPETLNDGLAAHLARAGVEMRARTPATDLERAGRRVTAVLTPHGPVLAGTVVIAAGAWSSAVGRMAGLRLPIEAGKGYSLDYAPPPLPIRRPLYLAGRRVGVCPTDGQVRLAGTMELAGLDDRLAPRRIGAMAAAARAFLPGWPAGRGGAFAWSGFRPLTPDGLPVIGPAPGWENLYVASGHQMLGITLAPATGEALAEAILSGRTLEVLRPFDPGRFA